MLKLILAAWSLVAGTVIVHATGLVIAVGPIVCAAAQPDLRFWPMTWLVIRTVWWLIVIHMLEIALWALFFWWQKCLPDAESSFYFAGVTYATVGYGDLVLPKDWRLLGPVEGLTGILMCGLSTGLFFAMASRLYSARANTATRE
ncbi:MAG TPA: potassium channel family protein [Candidatus Binatia bacterium]|nr:potassium channel family protein [Candidatus Binatia bacterium]